MQLLTLMFIAKVSVIKFNLSLFILVTSLVATMHCLIFIHFSFLLIRLSKWVYLQYILMFCCLY